MKKKQKSSTAAAAAPSTPPHFGDLKALIQSHRDFFDHLIDLIPARFYLPNDDAESKPWYQGLSKSAKAAMKQQSKQNLKLARANRLDPDKKPNSSTLHLLHQQITKTTTEPDDDLANPNDDGPVNFAENSNDGGNGSTKNATYEELRQKLRRKIEMLRGNRGDGTERKEKEKRMENKKGKQGNGKRKRGENDGEEKEKGAQSEEEIIEYGKVRLGDDEDKKGKGKKRKKMSKVKELERAKRLQEVKRENPTVAEKESWRAAENRAMGVKVHDDPRLIKESMKKEKKRKEKHAEKWQERKQSQDKGKAERQAKRRENIGGRIKEKKMRKIAKREKKLMRPGFEGRKEGFITNQE